MRGPSSPRGGSSQGRCRLSYLVVALVVVMGILSMTMLSSTFLNLNASWSSRDVLPQKIAEIERKLAELEKHHTFVKRGNEADELQSKDLAASTKKLQEVIDDRTAHRDVTKAPEVMNDGGGVSLVDLLLEDEIFMKFLKETVPPIPEHKRRCDEICVDYDQVVAQRQKQSRMNKVETEPSERENKLCEQLKDCGLPCTNIDVAYLWVNGSDAGFQAKKRFSKELLRKTNKNITIVPVAIAKNRARDLGMLRYSLRSLHQHAKFVRRIFIVVDNQIPRYVNTSHDRIRLFDQKWLIPDTVPYKLNFNSNSLSWLLPFIPTISTSFLYINDDYFFGHEVPLSAFINPNGGPVYYEGRNGRNWNKCKNIKEQYICSIANSKKALLAVFPAPRKMYKSIGHAPFVIPKSAVTRAMKRWPDKINATIHHPFRDPYDLQIEMTLAYSSLHDGTGKMVLERHQRGILLFVKLTGNRLGNFALFEKITRHSPLLFNLNDDMGGDPLQSLMEDVQVFLDDKFPVGSPWEVDPGAVSRGIFEY